MSTYASQRDVERYIEGWVTDDPIALERLIQRAEGEIDRLIRPLNWDLPPTQVISIGGATGGSFTVSFSGNVTPAQTFGTTGLALQAALSLLPGIGIDNVTVLGNNPYTVVWERQWAQTYTGLSVPLLTVDASQVTGVPVVDVAVVTGRRVEPLVDLTTNQARHLADATCAQVEYRNAMGEAEFNRPQYASVKGPDFTTVGRIPFIGPKVKRELSGTGLILVSGRATAGYARRGVGRGWATY